MSRRRRVALAIGFIAIGLCAIAAYASDAELYFSSDKGGQQRVTNVQEGSRVWFVVYDPDENIDCDVRDKIWTEVKLIDPKTGAHSAWVSYMDENGDANGREYHHDPGNDGLPDYTPYRGHFPGNPGWLGGDYLEETGPDTGVFVSKRSFQIGTRENVDVPRMNTHVVCNTLSTVPSATLDGPWLSDFVFGGFLYHDGLRLYMNGYGGGGFIPMPMDASCEWDDVEEEVFPDARIRGADTNNWIVGRFENMDTLVGIYQDQNDDTDIAIAMMKIIDTEASIAWNREVYDDANSAATITVADPDENLDCSQVEYVPVFILVNPGSWNPVDDDLSPTDFCMLKRTGGLAGNTGAAHWKEDPIRWYNIYHSEANAVGFSGAEDGRYYIEYPVASDDNVTSFDTADGDGLTAVSFYAQETGVNTGIFQLNLNSILIDLGFNSLNVRDVLVAYYLDPNDFDDFKLATSYIEAKQHSITSFSDENRQDQNIYWIGRDPIYVQVIDANANVDPCRPERVAVHFCDPHGEDDAEWWILDETSSNSPVFFSPTGLELAAVWDALGVGADPANTGGFQLQLDNWTFETFNEDDVYARYNDVEHVDRTEGFNEGFDGFGDSQSDGPIHAFPPTIDHTRVANDVSFDLMSIADTQVFDGETTQMWFLDRQGNRVSGYVSSDCVFVGVVDPDQDEDPFRRERIDAFWSGGQGGPIGAMALNDWDCGTERLLVNDWNLLFPDTNIFYNSPDNGVGRFVNVQTGDNAGTNVAGWGKLYVANLRNGRWAPIDLLETGTATGEFVSVICIDLVDVYECAPTLGALPGDTIVAVYQDPSNHSDSAWISIKVGMGGGSTSPSQPSTTMFVDADGNDVASYAENSGVFVKVTAPSHVGEPLLANAVEIDGITYDLAIHYDAQTFAASGIFMTDAIDLSLDAGDELIATYSDPTDPLDISSDTISVVSSLLVIESFFAGPNPFEVDVRFSYIGTGTASLITVTIHDLNGRMMQELSATNATEIVWDGTMGVRCAPLANGAYIYVITATDGTNTYSDRGKVFIHR